MLIYDMVCRVAKMHGAGEGLPVCCDPTLQPLLFQVLQFVQSGSAD